MITSRPVEFDSAEDAPRRGVGLSSRPRLRRVAEIRIQETPEGLKVFAKVLVQEQATRAYQMLAQESAGGDDPGQTAIDRDAATTADQNAVWRTLRRDKAAEHDLLSAVLERTGGDQPKPQTPKGQ